MKANVAKLYWILLPLLLAACGSPPPPVAAPLPSNWEEVEAQAKGQTLTFMMWQGDPLINRYIRAYVAPALRAQYGIELRVVAGQGNDIVRLLMAEAEAGQAESEVDMLWINGETFFQLRQIQALYGPFAQQLPNSRYIDWENPFIGMDFQQPVEGYECPWGNVQLALIYHSGRVPQPPMTLEALAQWVKDHPGKLTIGHDFTGMTLLKSWLIHLAGGPAALQGPFSEEKYQRHSQALWAYVRQLRPYLWNEGRSFPTSVAQMHQLYAAGELLMTMSNNDAEVDNKILEGIFPPESRAYVPLTGTIQNSHYLGISARSANKAAAMVACNFLISPAAQFEKLQPAVWGDGSVLSVDKLPAEWQQRFAAVPGRRQAPARADIQARALMEPAPAYMIRLFEDFRKEVIEKQD